MDYSSLILSNQKDEYISIQKMNAKYVCLWTYYIILAPTLYKTTTLTVKESKPGIIQASKIHRLFKDF